jgi:hypothetical protein
VVFLEMPVEGRYFRPSFGSRWQAFPARVSACAADHRALGRRAGFASVAILGKPIEGLLAGTELHARLRASRPPTTSD